MTRRPKASLDKRRRDVESFVGDGRVVEKVSSHSPSSRRLTVGGLHPFSSERTSEFSSTMRRLSSIFVRLPTRTRTGGLAGVLVHPLVQPFVR